VLLLSREELELESQILGQSDELCALLFNPQQCIDADDVCGDELVELQPRRLGPLSTSFKKSGNLRLGEASSQMNDAPLSLVSNLNPTRHNPLNAKRDPTDINKNAGESTCHPPWVVTAPQRATTGGNITPNGYRISE
jgi:hypothetical protein